MAKVGLKETLALLAAGYKKKDIEALAAIDDEEQEKEPEAPAPVITDSAPAKHENQETEKEPEPDYKKMYEDLQKTNKENEDKLKRIQKENINKNSAPLAAEQKAKEQESLNALVRSFM